MPSLATIETSIRQSRSLIVALATIWLWDGILAFKDDVELFKRSRISLPDVAYLLSRITVLGSLVALLVPLVITVPNCAAHGRVIVWLSVLSLPLNALLFLMRIRAIFYDSKLIQAFFVFLWLTVLAGSLFQPSCVGFTNHDLPTGTVTPDQSGGIVVWADQTLLQWRWHSTALENVIEIWATILSTRPNLRSVGIIPSLVFTNIMAARIYREVKLGLLNDCTNRPHSPSPTRTSSLGPSTVRFQNSLPLSDFRTPSASTDSAPHTRI
ncbi:hypothetical protein NLI96_g7146 [Meripilus lineatus]|uniref:DUF6533 domain-containing protein n=1 Tax=Meripilus lineatus TaxID=2056292 RepID=A0AAD5YHI7_9APHY|nr:hypothetical protein NLI96_g7146 [Physisporinus lineatus]